MWLGVTPELMSDEESNDENEIVIRKLPWICPELQANKDILDERIKKDKFHKRRRLGEMSDRPPSSSVPIQYLVLNEQSVPEPVPAQTALFH